MGLKMEMGVIEQIAEMKRIHSAIESSLSESTPGCLVVSSAAPGEGKTLLAGGLASFSARMKDQSVLVIDMNWRTPALHRCFGLEQSFDLKEMQTAPSVLKFVQPSGIGRLDVLTAPVFNQDDAKGGGFDPISGVDIMAQARGAYEMVIVDTSAILRTNRSMMDPVIFSKEADGILMVVLNCVTPKQEVKQAHMILKASGANVLGVVVNHWKNPMR